MLMRKFRFVKVGLVDFCEDVCYNEKIGFEHSTLRKNYPPQKTGSFSASYELFEL